MLKIFKFISMIVLLTFLLGVQDGYIALWKDGQVTPVRVFPYKADTLPPEDQKALKNGIILDENSQLAQLLEDYLS